MSALLFLSMGCVFGLSGLDEDAADDQAAPACGEDEAVFVERVWEPVMADQCALCHAAGGPAAGTGFVLDPDDMGASMRAASAAGERLLLKPAGATEDGHGGGAIALEGTARYEALAFWVAWSGGDCDLTAPTCEETALPRRLRRLSHAEYDRTISALLGLDSAHGAGFAADESVDGYDNDAQALTVSSLLADQYRSAAESLSEEADLDALLPCDPLSQGYTACATLFVEDFGLRAFRRPLNEGELDAYVGLWESVAAEEDFELGIRWVIAAMLQSPNFLYRSELGEQTGDGAFELTDWEIASELSYLLWGAPPDDELLAAAEAGALGTQAEIRAQVERMMADERALEIAADFVEVWLELDGLQTVSREGLEDELRESLAAETRAVVQEIAASGGSLADLMTSQTTWLDETAADHYGVGETGWVEMDPSKYGGLLTHGSVLVTHGLPSGSGPIQRGVMVRERLLCEPLPPPPPSLDTSPPEVDDSLSTRERYAQHGTDPQCAVCHTLIDPLGFGFESYDQLGLWRGEDDGHPIDASGAVDGVAFDGAAGLAEALLDDPRLHACFVETWQRWGTGADACGEDPGDVALTDPLVALTERADFTVRYGGAEEGDTLAVGPRLSLDELPADDRDYSGGVELTLTTNTSWGEGWCADGLVTNEGAEAVTWEVSAAASGTIYTIWNAEYVEDGDTVYFTGAEWNATLEPGEETTFGFCANY